MSKRIRIGLICALIAQAIFSFATPGVASASTEALAQLRAIEPALARYLRPMPIRQPVDLNPRVPKADNPRENVRSNRPAPLREEVTPTLSIFSTPWGTLDNDHPATEGPHAFVVEAVITNTSSITTMENLEIVLDYDDEDPLSPWELLPGEIETRTLDSLPPGEVHHAYWFARYSSVPRAGHQYTVTAYADHANPVATSRNYYEDLGGDTIRTRSVQDTGKSGLPSASAEIIVGVAFTVTTEYDLGQSASRLLFSPTGDPDLNAGAYRLLSSAVTLYDDAGTQNTTYNDRLYIETLPDFAEKALITYTFIAVRPSDTYLCPYATVAYGKDPTKYTYMYDTHYCDASWSTTVPITGTLSFSLTKEVSSLTIQQNELLTYTIHYTNNGTLPLTYAWVWDQVDTANSSIIAHTFGHDAGETKLDQGQVAWYLGDVLPGASGMFTVTVWVDGAEEDIANGTDVVNHALFGINQGSRPDSAALTSTVSTAVQAPVISISKADGRATVEAGDLLTYTLIVTNSGPVAATSVVVTDMLPADVVYVPGTASETGRDGQTLSWNNLGATAGTIAPGETVSITIPVTVRSKLLSGTVLANQMAVRYWNPAGWPFTVRMATDTTTVLAPDLDISKQVAETVLVGRSLTYTLHYANSGLVAATNVVITDEVPSNVNYQTCSGGDSCGESGGVVSWTIGTVPSRTNGTVSFSVWVPSSLSTGDLIVNSDYGIVAYGTITDQTDFVPGPPVTTTASRQAGYVNGFTFIDANGNGAYDNASEATLSDITVTLDGPNTHLLTATTSITGFYRFRVEYDDEPISVTAALPAGYFRTTPGTVFTYSIYGITQTVNFGYAPIASTFGVIYGTVFHDANHNAGHDQGENGLPGVEITSTDTPSSPVTTNQLGQYTLRYEVSGTVTITETNPDYYVSTTPDVVHTAAVTGSSGPSPIDFADFLGVRITGQVFVDADVDGAKDPGEGGLSGATVAANGGMATTTGSTGVYTLYITVDDSHPITITETNPPGYVSTNAIPGELMNRVDANRLSIDGPISGTVYTGGDFGDVRASDVITISGRVWEDLNADGQPDGEPGLSGAVVSLSTGMTQTTSSDLDGAFQLYAPPSTTVTVTETNPTGYASTNAIPGNAATKLDNDTLIASALVSGSASAGNLFGDAPIGGVAIITGTVFDDENENGVFDEDGGEVGIPGVMVILEAGSSVIDVHTDPAGNYEFGITPGSDVRITSAGPGGGFYPTTVESVILRPPSPGVYPGNNLGYSDDTDVAVISGLVFDDVDSDGEQEPGELGLPGAVITLANSDPPITTTTGGSGLITGTFTFSVTAVITDPVVYGLYEQNPSGYRSTTPDHMNVQVVSGTLAYSVLFGDTDNAGTASIYGTVFEDADGDGLQGPTEPGIAGVVISVTVSEGVLTRTTKTYGQYSYGFQVEEEGDHAVREQDPAKPGYRSTTPDEVILEIVLGNSYPVDFGDVPITATFSTIMGTVFYDVSGDGKQQIGEEAGLEGVDVALVDSGGQQITATKTRDYGQYTFPITVTDYIRAVETDPPGFHSTTPNTVMVSVTATGQVYSVDFGDSDYDLTSLFGTVFDDQNVNGARDLTEPALSGVTVTISGPFGVAAPAPYVTNEWGQFTFPIDVTGIFTVTETDLPSFVSTSAIPGHPAVTKVDNNTLRATVSWLGTDLGDNMFGDVRASDVTTITGFVWNDNGAGGGTAGNGVWDLGEPGLPGALVSLSSGPAQATASDGAFLLHAPPNQVITVTETDPAGYLSTNAVAGTNATRVDTNTLRVSGLVNGSTSAGNLFGDVLPVDVAVVKSASSDAVAAGGVLTYTLEYNNYGIFDAQDVTITDTLPPEAMFGGAGEPGTVIPPDLIWQIPTLAGGSGGTIVFTVTVRPDAAGTIINSVIITTTTHDPNADNNADDEVTTIGVPDLATIYGFVFEDLDGNGERDDDEVGIPGVTVTLDSAFTATTDPSGLYFFVTPVSGTRTVVETDLPDYFSTTPNEVHVEVSLGESHRVDFGDAPRGIADFAAIYGTVFEDLDSDGEWDDDEVGIQGVRITLDGEAQTVTGMYGGYTLSTTETVTHTVVETDLPGYLSTTPNNQIVPVVMLGTSYEINFGDVLAPSCTCPADRYEEDDSLEQAKGLSIGRWQEHDFCDDATDWITFTAEADNVYAITTSSWGQRADTVLALFDTDGQTPLAENDDYAGATDFSSRIVWMAPTDGVYYVCVTNRAALTGCNTTYNVWIQPQELFRMYLPIVMRDYGTPTAVARQEVAPEVSNLGPTGIISHTCPDAYEVDDTWEQARAITEVVQIHSFDSDPVTFAADKDFVWFDIADWSTITFTTAQVTDTQTTLLPSMILLELYDEYGTALGRADIGQLVWPNATAGRYILGMSPLTTTFGCTTTVGYRLRLETQVEVEGHMFIYLPLVTRAF